MRTLRLVALVGMLAACSSDEPAGGGSTTTTTLSGSLAASDGRTGSLTLSGEVPSASAVAGPTAVSLSVRALITLTGTVSLSDGTTATLTGTWDNVSGDITITGGGYSFVGTLVNGALSGPFSGPSVTGFFSLRVAATSAGSDVYCGTFTGREPEDDPLGNPSFGPDNGTWNLVVTGPDVDVIVLSDEGSPAVLGGTRSGQTVTITIPGAGSATGTISGAADEFVKGTYTVAGGGYGTFQGSMAYCTATTESAPVASITLNHPGIGTTGALGRLLYDSTLVFATAWDAQGNIVAAPQLTWGRSGPTRTNAQVTPPGTRWLVPDTTGWANVQQIMSASVTVTSVTNPAATAARTLMVHTY
jgi:hypothetical protein